MIMLFLQMYSVFITERLISLRAYDAYHRFDSCLWPSNVCRRNLRIQGVSIRNGANGSLFASPQVSHWFWSMANQVAIYDVAEAYANAIPFHPTSSSLQLMYSPKFSKKQFSLAS